MFYEINYVWKKFPVPVYSLFFFQYNKSKYAEGTHTAR